MIVMDRHNFVNAVDKVVTRTYRAGVRDVDATPTGWREAGSGKVALFLHGLGGSRVAWRPQLSGPLPTWRRCIAWDAPGYGVSAPVDSPSFNQYAQRAVDLMDELAPNAQIDVVGMSFGGMIAQYMAAQAPHRIRSLTLLCTSPKFGLDGTDPDEWRQARLSGLEQFGSPAAAAPAVLSALTADPQVVPEAVEAMSRVPMAGLMDALATITTHDTRGLLPTVLTPTLVLVGDKDDETPVPYAQAIVEAMPNARLQVIPGAGHLLNLEAPDEVNEAIKSHWITSEETP